LTPIWVMCPHTWWYSSDSTVQRPSSGAAPKSALSEKEALALPWMTASASPGGIGTCRRVQSSRTLRAYVSTLDRYGSADIQRFSIGPNLSSTVSGGGMRVVPPPCADEHACSSLRTVSCAAAAEATTRMSRLLSGSLLIFAAAD